MDQLNRVISYFFQLHLILHTRVWIFDVTYIVRKFLGTKQDFRWTLFYEKSRRTYTSRTSQSAIWLHDSSKGKEKNMRFSNIFAA